MQVLSVNNVRDRLDVILAEVQDSYEPLTIAGEKHCNSLILGLFSQAQNVLNIFFREP
jgi:hypothetical protein